MASNEKQESRYQNFDAKICWDICPRILAPPRSEQFVSLKPNRIGPRTNI